jgi:anti-sigma regulatory factor (Ser/Thr protein kinase)
MAEAAELERMRARALRARAAGIRRTSELLAERIVETGIGSPQRLGDRGDVFWLRLWKMGSAVRLVRHHLRRWLDGHGVASDAAMEIVLACSEACANAVEHPAASVRQAFEVEARRDERELTLSVRDFGDWRELGESAWRGRGLEMMRSLMDTVEVVPGRGGTRIVMRRRLET